MIMTKSQMLDKIKKLVEKLNFYLSSNDHLILWQGNGYFEVENSGGAFAWEENGCLILNIKNGHIEYWLSTDDKGVYSKQGLLNCLNDLNRFKVIVKTDIKSIL